jgi:hypothetical protein
MYEQDGLSTIHNHDFMNDAAFVKAYQRGVKAVGQDYKWHWRVHIGLWAARTAVRLPGDFVECGVNAGFMSSSIMCDLDWDTQGKIFYLLDTFCGLNQTQVTREEMREGVLEKNKHLIENGFYVTSSKNVRNNFSEWKNIRIIEGVIPDTLPQIISEEISFLHIDLNCAPPEVASITFLWDRLVTGAIILLDDYAYAGYHHQKHEMDKFTQKIGVSIASLPTGQGLIIKT